MSSDLKHFPFSEVNDCFVPHHCNWTVIAFDVFHQHIPCSYCLLLPLGAGVLYIWSTSVRKTETRLHVSSYPWSIAIFPWQWKQIQLKLISVFSQPRYVWEKASFCPLSIKAWSFPLLNMLIHLVDPLLILPTRPPLPHSSFPTGKKADLESLQLRLGPGLHPPVDYVWCREEGEGALHVIIPLTIPVPYGQRNGFSSGSQRSGKHDLLLQSGHVFIEGCLSLQIISHSGLFIVLFQVFYNHIFMVQYYR